MENWEKKTLLRVESENLLQILKFSDSISRHIWLSGYLDKMN